VPNLLVGMQTVFFSFRGIREKGSGDVVIAVCVQWDRYIVYTVYSVRNSWHDNAPTRIQEREKKRKKRGEGKRERKKRMEKGKEEKKSEKWGMVRRNYVKEEET